MTYEANMGAAAISNLDRISIRLRSGVWCVELNGKFYGDYTRKYWALEAAFEKADDISLKGGAATITWATDGRQDALLYDSRSASPAPLEPEPRALDARSPRKQRLWPSLGEMFGRGRTAKANS